jgi:hypothetical protein
MDITQAFLSDVKNNEEFLEALEIVKKNSAGKLWLIGGFVYRTITSQLYRLPKTKVDLDFIVEYPVSNFELPNGWRIDENRFGNPKLVNDKKQIDYVPLGNIYSIIQRQIQPTIDNFLKNVPLTVQSIVYNVQENIIIGDVGINALKKRVVEVNDLYFAEYAAKKKNKSLQEMIKEKATELDFIPIFPEYKSYL